VGNIEIVLIALVAIFLALRLRAVLGRRTGNEKPPADDPFAAPKAPPSLPGAGGPGEVVRLPSPVGGPRGQIAAVSSAAGPGVEAIRRADPSFDPNGFASGARAAFEMIVAAFAKGDAAALKPLLDAPTYASFAGAIADREARKESLETTLIGFLSSEISAAELRGREALVTVKFVTEQINVTRGADGLIVDGNPNEVEKVTDLWTFRRDTSTDDPNWLLVKTESE
jgi:predicted lipid-binding transport protein (Tim44 family)